MLENHHLLEARPVTEQEFHVRHELASFTLPLGATVNMNGIAAYYAVTVLFVSQIYGVRIDPADRSAVRAPRTLTIDLIKLHGSLNWYPVKGASDPLDLKNVCQVEPCDRSSPSTARIRPSTFRWRMRRNRSCEGAFSTCSGARRTIT